MLDYLSFWFAKFLMDVAITFGFIVCIALFFIFQTWKYGNKKNTK